MKQKKITASVVLPGALYQDNGRYSSGGYADLDLAADEKGLWAVYTTIANDRFIVISQLDPVSLQVCTT